MKRYLREEATINRNEYGEEITTYSPIDYIKMFITFSAFADQVQNQVAFDEYTHIGLTKAVLSKGQRIDSKYLVVYVLDSKPFNRVFLKEIQ